MSNQLAKIKSLTEFADDMISQLFQLERLDKLAEGSVFLKVAYAGLIGNINYAILHNKTEIDGSAGIVIANITYPFTLEGRKAAIAESFRHFSNKLDDFLSVTNITAILGELDFIADVAKAAIPKTMIHVKK